MLNQVDNEKATSGPYKGEHWNRCYNCNVYFTTLLAAREHFTAPTTRCSEHWCRRCERVFKTPRAREEHFTHNWVHWRCGVGDCGYDGWTVGAQERHWRKSGHKIECLGCQSWFEESWFAEHSAAVAACLVCGVHCDTDDAKVEHEKEHEINPPTVHTCIGHCGREFPTLGGMYVHLESGACDSTITSQDVSRTFALHAAADMLLVADRKAVLQPLLTGGEPLIAPFKCPGAQCGEVFKCFSGFLQHAETARCGFSFSRSGDSNSMLAHMTTHLFLDTVIARIDRMEGAIRSGIQVLAIPPEHPRERKGAAMPNADRMRGFFTLVTKNIQACLREVLCLPSSTDEGRGVLKVKIPRAFARELGELERAYERAMKGYAEAVVEVRQPHGDLIVYFQATKASMPAWDFLRDVGQLVRVFRVMVDWQQGL
ncbi:hypothetical protein Dda_2604 [Drechslerella dactyloides]|uniref:C2H2-type domain-containing protein n=1 Tax=Drechslerella dactyloides TaxID=74499 RepID=A0AAD6NKX5_DREDA|nr:hypothetical protein Dda_2604 [Drechslerella dactyloides]